jgi:RNA polymerase sigma factor (sigma-70 family)
LNNLTVEQKVVKYQLAEDKKLKDDLFVSIVDDLQGVIRGVANKWENSLPMDKDDIKSELVIVLFDVLDDFDENNGSKVSTLCNTYFTNRLRVIYNKFNTQKRSNVHGDDYSMEMVNESNDIELGAELAETLSFTVNDYREVELKCFLEELDLDRKEMVICNLLVKGYTNKSEIARKLDVTPAGISYLIGKIKGKMSLRLSIA